MTQDADIDAETCWHCGKDLSELDPHTDQPSEGFWVDSCEECCTVCQVEQVQRNTTTEVKHDR